jgi:hypothetical protein
MLSSHRGASRAEWSSRVEAGKSPGRCPLEGGRHYKQVAQVAHACSHDDCWLKANEFLSSCCGGSE